MPKKGALKLFDRRKLKKQRGRDLSFYVNRMGETVNWTDIVQTLNDVIPGHYILTHRYISFPQCLTGRRTRRVSKIFSFRDPHRPIYLLEDFKTTKYIDGKKMQILFLLIDKDSETGQQTIR